MARALAVLLAGMLLAGMLLAGCLAPALDEPRRPRAARDAGPGPLPRAWVFESLPEAPVAFDELAERVAALKDSPRATVLVEGVSLQERPLLGVLLAEGAPEGKPTVFLTGSQHGNEPAGADAALLLATWLAWGGDEAKALLGELNVYLLVCANPDGRVLDQRGNAEGVDINRDHMDLASPEARTLHAVYTRVDPAVIVDLHQFGSPPLDAPPTPVSSSVLFEVASVQNPLAYPGIIAAGHELEGHVVDAVTSEFGPGSASSYPPTDSSQDSSIHRNHYGMHNSLSLLFEARRGLAGYAMEVKLHLVGALEVLDQVAQDPAAKLAAKAEAEREWQRAALPVRAYLAPPQAGLDHLAALLAAHALNASLSGEAFGTTGVHYGVSAQPLRADFPEGTLVATLAQPDWRTAGEMFESSSRKDPHYTAGPRDAGLDVYRSVEP